MKHLYTGFQIIKHHVYDQGFPRLWQNLVKLLYNHHSQHDRNYS